MTADKKQPVIQVYCPEALKMIEPGEFDFCPYYQGEKLDMSDTDAIAKQIFRCHAKCGCPIEYQYYEGDKIVSKTINILKDESTLKDIITGVVNVNEALGEEASYKKREVTKPAAGPKKKILLVDDDLELLNALSGLLKLNNYEIRTASNEPDAINVYNEFKPDLVVLDVMMEFLDSGFRIGKQIKAINPESKIVYLTSISERTKMKFAPKTEDQHKLMGAEDFIEKPVIPEVILESIKKLF